MKGFHIRIYWLMVVIVFIALGFAAIKQPFSSIPASVTFMMTILVLMTTSLRSLFNQKITWAGFSLFGWVYLFLAFGPWRTAIATPLPVLPSTLLLYHILDHFYSQNLPAGLGFTTGREVQGLLTNDGSRQLCVPFGILQVANCLFSLLVACLGSLVGYFNRRRNH